MSKDNKVLKKIKSTVLSLLGSVLMLVLAGLIGATVAVYQTYSAEKYMNDFYECFLNESYTALYGSSNVKESDFITDSSFTQMMVNNYGYEETDKYSISDIIKNGKYAKATVSFTDSETNKEVKWDLNLEKSDKKHYLFFNEWQVNIDDFIIDNVKLMASEEVEIVIDDKNISVEDVKGVTKKFNEETGIVTYTIDRMFSGDHTIMFIGKHTQAENFVATFDKEHKSYTFTDGDLKQEEQDAIAKLATSIVVEMYNAAFTNAGTDTLRTYFASTASHNADATYISMLGAINQENGAMLETIDIKEYSMVFDRYDYSGRTSVEFFYTAAFEAKKPRVIDGGVVIDGVRQSYIGEAKATATITFEYIDDKWQAIGIKMQCIDYSEANKIEVEEEE